MRSKTCRLDLHTTPELRAKMEAEAERRGQSLTVFVTRALEAALGHTGDPAGLGSALADPGAPPTRPTSPRTPVRETPAMARQRKLNDAKSKPPKRVKT